MRNSKPSRRSLYDYDQPFDLFEEFEKGVTRTKLAEPIPRRRPGKRNFLIAAMGFASLVTLIFVSLGYFSRPETTKTFVLMEVRAISPSGNPVAGANVNIKGIKLGVTDSFGEWRRYLKMSPGTQFDLVVGKRKDNYLLQGRKQILVPEEVSQNGEAEMKVSLELVKLTRIKPKPKARSDVSSKGRASTKTIRGNDTAIEVVDMGARSDGDPGQSQARNDTKHLNHIDIRYHRSPHSYGTLMEAHQSRVLGTRIVPEMVALASESGIKMSRNASWKYDIHYIPHEGNVGFIKGAATWINHRGEMQQLSFLRNFAKTIEETADMLIKLVKHHVNRNYRIVKVGSLWVLADYGIPEFWRPRSQSLMMSSADKRVKLVGHRTGLVVKGNRSPCLPEQSECVLRSLSYAQNPPIPTWKAEKISLRGEIGDKAEVYIGGFRAFRDKSKKHVWRYWVSPGKSHNLTVVDNNKIVFRSRFKHYPGEHLAMTLPQRLARR